MKKLMFLIGLTMLVVMSGFVSATSARYWKIVTFGQSDTNGALMTEIDFGNNETVSSMLVQNYTGDLFELNGCSGGSCLYDDSDYTTNYVQGAKQGYNLTIYTDLGSAKSVDLVVMYNGYSGGQDQYDPSLVYLSSSSDNITWTLEQQIGSYSSTGINNASAGDIHYVKFDSISSTPAEIQGISARYWKVQWAGQSDTNGVLTNEIVLGANETWSSYYIEQHPSDTQWLLKDCVAGACLHDATYPDGDTGYLQGGYHDAYVTVYVDLGSIKDISFAQIYNCYNGGIDSYDPSVVNISSSNDNIVWNLVSTSGTYGATGINNNSGGVLNDNGGACHNVFLTNFQSYNEPSVARYWKLNWSAASTDPSNGMIVTEVDIGVTTGMQSPINHYYERGLTDNNPSENCNKTSLSSCYFDNNSNTYYTKDSFADNVSSLYFDLGSELGIDYIKIGNNYNSGTQYRADFVGVYASHDNYTWHNMTTIGNPTSDTAIAWDNDPGGLVNIYNMTDFNQLSSESVINSNPYIWPSNDVKTTSNLSITFNATTETIDQLIFNCYNVNNLSSPIVSTIGLPRGAHISTKNVDTDIGLTKPIDLDYDGTYVWVLNNANDSVFRFDSGAITYDKIYSLSEPSSTYFIASNQSYLFILGKNGFGNYTLFYYFSNGTYTGTSYDIESSLGIAHPVGMDYVVEDGGEKRLYLYDYHEFFSSIYSTAYIFDMSDTSLRKVKSTTFNSWSLTNFGLHMGKDYIVTTNSGTNSLLFYDRGGLLYTSNYTVPVRLRSVTYNGSMYIGSAYESTNGKFYYFTGPDGQNTITSKTLTNVTLIDSSTTQKHYEWGAMCNATNANKPWIKSSNTWSASNVTIINTPPTQPSQSIQPKTYKVGNTLYLNATGSTDADGDTICYYYSIRNESGGYYFQDNTYTCGSKAWTVPTTAAHQQLRGYAIPTDIDSNNTVYSETTTIANTLPTIPTGISFNISTWYVNTIFSGTSTGSIDVDGDTLTKYYYVVNTDDASVRKANSTINYYGVVQADAHDNLRVGAFTNDGYGNSSIYTTDKTISNSAPSSVVVSTNLTVKVNEYYNFSCSATDIDNDPMTYAYWVWNYNDTTTVKNWEVSTNYTVQSSDAHDEFWINCRAIDNYAAGTDSSRIYKLVNNTMPTTNSVSLSDNKKVTESLSASCSGTDVDGDSLIYYYQFNNTANTWRTQPYSTTSTFSLNQTDAHDLMQVECYSYDNALSGTTTATDTTTVADTLPTVPTGMTNLPGSYQVGNTILTQGSGSTDVDGDTITYKYNFYNYNDSADRIAWGTTQQYQLQQIDAHEIMTISTKASTTYGDGDSYSINTTVQDTAPTTPTSYTDFPPVNLYVTDLVTATSTGSTDADGDTITYYYRFFNPIDLSFLTDWTTNNTYRVETSDAHDQIRVYSKSVTSYSNSTNNLTSTDNVDNSAPSTPTDLAVTPAGIGETLTASCSSSDADADSLDYYYEFYNVNDTSTLQAFSTDDDYVAHISTAHDLIRVRCKSNDGYVYSGIDEYNLTISNYIPAVNDTNITPSGALASNNITCVYSTYDADGDSLNPTIYWYNESKMVTDFINSSYVDSLNLSEGQNWTCNVSVNDGRNDSTWTKSETMTLGDGTAPVLLNDTLSSTSGSNNAPFTIYVNVSELNSISWVYVEITNPATFKQNYTMGAFNSSDPLNERYNYTYGPVSILDGTYYFNFYASDGSGNIGMLDSNLTYTESTVAEGGGGGGGSTREADLVTAGNFSGFCGDNICSSTENPNSCPSDCKINFDSLVTCIWDENIQCNYEQNWFAVVLLVFLGGIMAFVIYSSEASKK